MAESQERPAENRIYPSQFLVENGTQSCQRLEVKGEPAAGQWLCWTQGGLRETQPCVSASRS